MIVPDDQKSIEIQTFLKSVGLEFQPSVGLWYSHRTGKFVNTFSKPRTLNDIFTGYSGSFGSLDRDDVIGYATKLVPKESKEYNEKYTRNRPFEIPEPFAHLEPKTLIVCPVCYSCHDHVNSFKQHRSTYHRGNNEAHLQKKGYLIHSEKNFHNMFLINKLEPPEESTSDISLDAPTIDAMEAYLNSIGLEFKSSVGHWYCYRTKRFINMFMNDGAMYLRLTGSCEPLIKRDIIEYARSIQAPREYTKRYTPGKLFKIPRPVPGLEPQVLFVCPECHLAQTHYNNYKSHRSRYHRGSKATPENVSGYLILSVSTHYNILYHSDAAEEQPGSAPSQTRHQYLRSIRLEFYQSVGLWYSHKTKKFVNVSSESLGHIFTGSEPASFKNKVIEYARSCVPERSKKYNQLNDPNNLFRIDGPVPGLFAEKMIICPLCHSSHPDGNNFTNHNNKMHGGRVKEVPVEKLGYLVHSVKSNHNILYYDLETEKHPDELSTLVIQPKSAFEKYLTSIDLEFYESVGLWYSHRIGKFINVFSQNSRRSDIFTGTSAPLRKESVVQYTKSLVPKKSRMYNTKFSPNRLFRIPGPIPGLLAQVWTVCGICHSTHVDQGSFLHHSVQFHHGKAISRQRHGYLVHSENQHNNILVYETPLDKDTESTNDSISSTREADEYLRKYTTDEIFDYHIPWTSIPGEEKLKKISDLVYRYLIEERQVIVWIKEYRDYIDSTSSLVNYRWLHSIGEDSEKSHARDASKYLYTVVALKDIWPKDIDFECRQILDLLKDAFDSDDEQTGYECLKKACFFLGSVLTRPINNELPFENILFYGIHVSFLKSDTAFERPWHRTNILSGISTLFKISIIESFELDANACNAFVERVERSETDEIYYGKFQEITHQHRLLSNQDWGPEVAVLDEVGREISVNGVRFGLDDIHDILVGCVEDIEEVRELLIDIVSVSPAESLERVKKSANGNLFDLKYEWTSENLADFISKHLRNATPKQLEAMIEKLQTINDCLFLMILLTCGAPYRFQQLRLTFITDVALVARNVRLEGNLLKITTRSQSDCKQVSLTQVTKYVPLLVSKYLAYYVDVIRPLELELALFSDSETLKSTIVDIIDDEATDDAGEYIAKLNILLLELLNTPVSEQLGKFLFVGVNGLKTRAQLAQAVLSLTSRHSHQSTSFETIYQSLAYLTHGLIRREASKIDDEDREGPQDNLTQSEEVLMRWHYINELSIEDSDF